MSDFGSTAPTPVNMFIYHARSVQTTRATCRWFSSGGRQQQHYRKRSTNNETAQETIVRLRVNLATFQQSETDAKTAEATEVNLDKLTREALEGLTTAASIDTLSKAIAALEKMTGRSTLQSGDNAQTGVTSLLIRRLCLSPTARLCRSGVIVGIHKQLKGGMLPDLPAAKKEASDLKVQFSDKDVDMLADAVQSIQKATDIPKVHSIDWVVYVSVLQLFRCLTSEIWGTALGCQTDHDGLRFQCWMIFSMCRRFVMEGSPKQ